MVLSLDMSYIGCFGHFSKEASPHHLCSHKIEECWRRLPLRTYTKKKEFLMSGLFSILYWSSIQYGSNGLYVKQSAT